MNAKRTLSANLSLLAAVALALPGIAFGAPQQKIEDRRPVSPDVRVEIDDIIVGQIRVVGTDDNELYVTGTIGRDVDEFVIDGGPDWIEISAEWDDDMDDHESEGRRRWRGHGRDSKDVAIDIEIHVPRGASLEITGVTASISVDGVDGEIELETVTGEITYAGNAVTLEIVNVTGAISVTGGIIQEGCFESVMGSIHVEASAAVNASLDFQTVGGSIYFAGDIGEGSDLDFETVQGAVTLVLPASVSARFDIETMMGEIDNELGPEPRRTSRWLQSKELSFRTGSGDADVSIETLQGKITLRKQ